MAGFVSGLSGTGVEKHAALTCHFDQREKSLNDSLINNWPYLKGFLTKKRFEMTILDYFHTASIFSYGYHGPI